MTSTKCFSIKENNKVQKYNLDPMFEEKTILLEDYVKKVSVYSTSSLKYTLHSQDFEIKSLSDLSNISSTSQCYYSKFLIKKCE